MAHARRRTGRTAGDFGLGFLQNQDVPLAARGQMIGDRCTDDPGANDNDCSGVFAHPLFSRVLSPAFRRNVLDTSPMALSLGIKSAKPLECGDQAPLW